MIFNGKKGSGKEISIKCPDYEDCREMWLIDFDSASDFENQMIDDRDYHFGPISRFRFVFARLIGKRYRELPFGTLRKDIERALFELHGEKRGETGSPCNEVVNEYFWIGRRTIRVCTEDEMFVSLWGEKDPVDQVYTIVVEGCFQP